MAPGTTPKKRLGEIWREWGIPLDAGKAGMHQTALKALGAWLRDAPKHPERVVLATQLLMTDPQRPDERRRGVIKRFVEVVEESWPTVGTASEDVAYLQAMVLAAWPVGRKSDPWSLARLLDSAWRHVPVDVGHKRRLDVWRDSVPSEAEPKVVAHLTTPGLGGDQTPAPSARMPDKDPHLAWMENQKGKDHSFPNLAPYLISVLTRHGNAIRGLQTDVASLHGTISTTAQAVVESIEKAVDRSLRRLHSSASGQLELLWWGQARYSHTLRRPFRRLADSGAVLWWAAWEAAERSEALPSPPVAAFICETLHALGQDLTEQRPLVGWLEELAETLRRHAEYLTDVREPLAGLVTGDALGLPISWLRAQIAAGEVPDDLATAAGKAVSLDLTTPLDRGDWATWLLRELLLDRRLARGA